MTFLVLKLDTEVMWIAGCCIITGKSIRNQNTSHKFKNKSNVIKKKKKTPEASFHFFDFQPNSWINLCFLGGRTRRRKREICDTIEGGRRKEKEGGRGEADDVIYSGGRTLYYTEREREHIKYRWGAAERGRHHLFRSWQDEILNHGSHSHTQQQMKVCVYPVLQYAISRWL